MRMIIRLSFFLCILAVPLCAFPAEKGLTVKGVRFFPYASFTRIVFELSAAAPYVLTRSADGRSLELAAYDGPLVLAAQAPAIRDGVVAGIEAKEDAGRRTIIIRLDAGAGEAKDFVLRAPDRIVVDITRGAAPPVPAPQSSGKPVVVVLDPGHGGSDPGLVTAQGLEKTLTLEVALAIKKILQKDPRISVVLTREKDRELSIDERAAATNAAGALLLVSIHGAPGAGGRVYIQDLLDEAAVQGARPAAGDFLGYETGSEQEETRWGGQQAAHAQKSAGLGRRLARRLAGNDGAEPVQAPLAGLKAVDAAAALVEVGMMQDRSKAAEAVAGGIEQYVRENR